LQHHLVVLLGASHQAKLNHLISANDNAIRPKKQLQQLYHLANHFDAHTVAVAWSLADADGMVLLTPGKPQESFPT